MDAFDLARAFLLKSQCADGGWPYRGGGNSSPEPTCHALLSLGAAEATARQRGMEWLVGRLEGTGAVVLVNDSDPHWTTSLALFTLATLGAPSAVRERCAAFLLSWEGVHADPDPALPMDTSLRGWPWTSGAFTWVEPTCYALLALKRAGYAGHERVAEGERLLLDRMCDGGGWNNGNREILGRTLPPMTSITAWTLLALQGAAKAEDAVAQGLVVLEHGAAHYPSTLTLALATLACHVLGRPVETWAQALQERQSEDGSWRGQVHLTALSLLALQVVEGVGNAFQL